MFKNYRSRLAKTCLQQGFKLVCVIAAGAIAGACQSADQRLTRRINIGSSDKSW